MVIDELNLHGMSYEDAKREVDILINHHWDIEPGSLKIITGHSPNMRKTVIEVLDLYQLEYKIGGILGIDDSFIIV